MLILTEQYYILWLPLLGSSTAVDGQLIQQEAQLFSFAVNLNGIRFGHTTIGGVIIVII